MNFEFIATYVELQDIPSYSTTISVEGQLLKLSFLWNERIGKRVLSIKNSSDVVYLQNTILHPNEPLELNSNAVLDDLPYSVTLVKTGDANKVGNIFNWSKDFILCFSRTVDLDVKKLNVVYGVTTPSTPSLPPPEHPFGDWILNQGFTIVGEDIRYTGYKTNGTDTYDSFALSNLQDALVKSFLDPDLQQYAAFTTAVEQLLGAVDWVLDPVNNRIVYNEGAPVCSANNCAGWYYGSTFLTNVNDGATICNAWFPLTSVDKSQYQNGGPINFPSGNPYDGSNFRCYWRDDGGIAGSNIIYYRVKEGVLPQEEEKYLPLPVVTQKVISNAEAGEDEILQMLSQDYINLVANSVFDSNPSKQFVKLEDLIPQLEVNKVLR